MGYDWGEYLAHHGVKGQKWGVRRYQNEDGSLKPAGKKKLSIWKRLTHDKKSKILQKAIDKNEVKIYFSKQDRAYWRKEEKRLTKNGKGIKNPNKYYQADLEYARNRSKFAQERVDAWMRREKRLMSIDVDSLSTHQLRKQTTPKLHEQLIPDD